MTKAHLSNQQGLKSEMLIFQRVDDDNTAEKNRRRPLTWTMFGPCRRGIPHIQRTVFSSMTQQANHAGPPLLHKNPMSDPRRLAGDLITVAPESWGATVPAHGATLIINDMPTKKKTTNNKKKIYSEYHLNP